MRTIAKITKRQKEFLEAIYNSIETEGYPPTFEDLKHKFGQDKEPPRILGIGVLTDTDSTDTEAAADYDDFFLMKP